MEKIAVPVVEGFAALGIGRTKGYELIEAGRLKTILIGRRRLILVSSIKELVEELAESPYEPYPRET